MTTLEQLAYRLYTWCTYGLQPLVRRKLKRRAQTEPLYGQHLHERWGQYADDNDWFPPICINSEADEQRVIWIHAVSLGETRAAAILLQALRKQWPRMRLLLTHSTATGREAGRFLLQSGDQQAWLPWDMPSAVQQFFRQFQPTVGLLMETEVWPCLLQTAKQQAVPLVLVNARMNEASWRKARTLPWLSRPAYAALHDIWAQTRDDQLRLQDLGGHSSVVMGNLKFDATPAPDQCAQAKHLRQRLLKPVVVLASSREGEEALWLQNLQLAWREGNDAVQHAIDSIQWMVVPRHPQRFAQVADLIESFGWKVGLKSQWPTDENGCLTPPIEQELTIWLGDTMGEMAFYYSLASLSLLGGSYLKFGGQNLIESIACGCPVMMGPYTFNFAQAADQALQVGAAYAVPNFGQAIQLIVNFVQQPEQLAHARQCGQQLIAQHQGVAQRMAAQLQRLLDEPSVLQTQQ
jgi:3-deoxy-D-manno-octulosonic-acid transferase